MKEKILEILMLSKFTTRKQLLSQLSEYRYILTDRFLRQTIEDMIVEDHYSIASSEKGYSFIDTEDELKKAMLYLDKKAASIAIRKNCLTRNFHQHIEKKQLEIF